VVMYMREPTAATAELPAPGAAYKATFWVSALATLVLGVFPGLVLNFATGAAKLGG